MNRNHIVDKIRPLNCRAVLCPTTYLFGGIEAAFYDIPIDNIPNGLDIVGSNVPVVDIISMFPNVNSQQGSQSSGGLQGILVGTSGKVKFT